MNKTVILVWTQKCINKPNDFWGLGDLIRGTIRLLELSDKLNFKLEVNTVLHPISNFLKTKNSKYNELILNNRENIEFVLTKDVENYIKNSKDNVLFFSTNSLILNYNLIDKHKSFIKNILQPNDELNLYVDNLIKKYKLNKFQVIHYRLGDKYIDNSETDLDSNEFETLVNKILNNCEKNTLFLTDSQLFKNKFKSINLIDDKNIAILDLNICHLGYENDKHKIKDTLAEFFLITKSNKIKTYSTYEWISGFVFWISKIYDIPIIKI